MLYNMVYKDTSKYDFHEPSITLNNQQQQSLNSSGGFTKRGSFNMQRKQQLASTLTLTKLGIRLLNEMFFYDLKMVQTIVGEESSLLPSQLRHIASYLLNYLSVFGSDDELLNEIILLLGYFTVLNDNNQIKIELGTPPTILQQLCNLPFNYFADKRLIDILFPTLISFCFINEKNTIVLTSELSSQMLANFIDEKMTIECDNHRDKQEDYKNKMNKFSFKKRFPFRLWTEAKDYFSNNKNTI
jgi:hypothetical protein